MPPKKSQTFEGNRRKNLNIAGSNRLIKAAKGVTLWNEFLSHVSLKTSINNRLANGGVVQFLGLIDFIPPWISPSMVVPNVLVIGANIANDITFHGR